MKVRAGQLYIHAFYVAGRLRTEAGLAPAYQGRNIYQLL